MAAVVGSDGIDLRIASEASAPEGDFFGRVVYPFSFFHMSALSAVLIREGAEAGTAHVDTTPGKRCWSAEKLLSLSDGDKVVRMSCCDKYLLMSEFVSYMSLNRNAACKCCNKPVEVDLLVGVRGFSPEDIKLMNKKLRKKLCVDAGILYKFLGRSVEE